MAQHQAQPEHTLQARTLTGGLLTAGAMLLVAGPAAAIVLTVGPIGLTGVPFAAAEDPSGTPTPTEPSPSPPTPTEPKPSPPTPTEPLPSSTTPSPTPPPDDLPGNSDGHADSGQGGVHGKPPANVGNGDPHDNGRRGNNN